MPLTAAILGLGLSAIILYLIRRGHLYLQDGIFWIAIALISILLGLWPNLLNTLAGLVGVIYPPNLLFILASITLIIKMLMADIVLTSLRRDLRRLNQKIAILDAERGGVGQSCVDEPRP